MTIPLAAMKQDISGLIVEWGVSCIIKRKSSSSRNAAGQVSGSFSTVGTETLWIQPMSSRAMFQSGIKDQGIIDKTTHFAHERFSGTITQNNDRIEATGDTFAYDVLSSQILANFRLIYMQQVKRT